MRRLSKVFKAVQTRQVEGQHRVLPHYPIPSHIPKPFYYASQGKSANYSNVHQGKPKCYSPQTQDSLRKAAKIAAKALKNALECVKIGETTEEIDRVVHTTIIEAGAYPSGVYFMGFPKSVCTSVNEVLCHGVPNLRPLEDGDSLNIDVTCYIDDVYGDNSDMAEVGTVSAQVRELVRPKQIQFTRSTLDKAVEICRPGVKFSKIGELCQREASKLGYGICEEFSGHGIGQNMHEPPAVLHTLNKVDFLMQPGMCFTIEPIFTLNPNYDLEIWNDGWTVVDSLGGVSAQAEHQLLITDTGCEVLTKK
jgi:methionyl aminopeptidase